MSDGDKIPFDEYQSLVDKTMSTITDGIDKLRKEVKDDLDEIKQDLTKITDKIENIPVIYATKEELQSLKKTIMWAIGVSIPLIALIFSFIKTTN